MYAMVIFSINAKRVDCLTQQLAIPDVAPCAGRAGCHAAIMTRARKTNAWARRIREIYSGVGGVRYISLRDHLCEDHECGDRVGCPLNCDAHHFTLEGAELVVGRMFADGLVMNRSH
jgi:hypothetical protein